MCRVGPDGGQWVFQIEEAMSATDSRSPSALLACPFCGGQAYLDDLKVWPWSSWEYLAKCRICGIHGPGKWTTDKEQATQDWNTRHASNQP